VIHNLGEQKSKAQEKSKETELSHVVVLSEEEWRAVLIGLAKAGWHALQDAMSGDEGAAEAGVQLMDAAKRITAQLDRQQQGVGVE